MTSSPIDFKKRLEEICPRSRAIRLTETWHNPIVHIVYVASARWTGARGPVTALSAKARLSVLIRHQVAQELTGDELMWATWVATALGDVISAAPHIASPPTKERLAQIIGKCVERTSSGNASAFARLMHVGRGDVSRWQRGNALPRLALLLNMTFRLGAPLLNFLLGSPACVSLGGFLRSAPVEPDRGPRRTTIQHGRRMTDHPEVFRILQLALNENPPPSVTQVMKQISYSEVTVRRHFPELCRNIAKNYAAHREKRAVERKAQAAEEVKRLAYALHSQGVKLTRSHMRPLLTSSDYLNLEEGRAALRQVRQHLGLL